MTEVDGAVAALDSLPPVDVVPQQSERLVKPIEEEKVQDELAAATEAGTEASGTASVTDDKATEEHKEVTEPMEPIERRDEEVKEQEHEKEQSPLDTITESASDDLTSPAHHIADAQQDSDSDSDDDSDAELLVSAAAATSVHPTFTVSAPRPEYHASVLEQQIELDHKHDSEYHVPHLTDLDFSTPTPSQPATPVPATASTPLPFRFDPSIILLPDTERFCAASLPLLYPKLAMTLSRPDVRLDVKLAALACCVELVRSPLHVHELQSHGVLDELIVNAGAGDEQLRVLSTEALTWVVRQREARHYCRENGIVGRLGTLLIDHSVSVRLNAAAVLLQLSVSEPQLLYEPPISAAAGDAASVMAHLVRRVQSDTSESVKAVLLRCILCGLKQRVGLIVARYNTLLPVLSSLLPMSHPQLVAAACDCMAAVAVEDVDRQELLSLGLHAPLLQWLTADEVAVRRSAAGALMQATVGVTVKQAVVASGGVQLCALRIKGEEAVEAVLCVLLELLANLMESKKGKQLVADDDALLAAVRSRAEDKQASHNLHLSAQSALLKLTYAP